MILLISHKDLLVGLDFKGSDPDQHIDIDLNDPTKCKIDIKNQYAADIRFVTDPLVNAPPFKRGDIVKNYAAHTKCSKGIQCNRAIGAIHFPSRMCLPSTETILYDSNH